MSRIWSTSAPSNIALIKYMGKSDPDSNRPTNTSLSYTLDHLKSHVELELLDEGGNENRWEPLPASASGQKSLEPIVLSQRGRDRFLKHLQMLKDEFAYRGSFLLRSANDFPSDCGLASSASSFAALTSVAVQALVELTAGSPLETRDVAHWSRRGSGSSCRSFFSPWALWGPQQLCGIPDIPYRNLLHQVVIVSDLVKKVSSSEGHRRVPSSLLFQGRAERAELRAQKLRAALGNDRWREAFEICWAEFWDMHALFETSHPSFSYMTGDSMEVLRFVQHELWEKHGDGPLVTMDAGPNIHLLYRRDPKGIDSFHFVKDRLTKRFRVFSSEVG